MEGIPNGLHWWVNIPITNLAPTNPLFLQGIATIQPESLSTHTAIISYVAPSQTTEGILNKSIVTVGYIPGSQNMIPEILSRWAYPASQAYRDISKHGTIKDLEEMEDFFYRKKKRKINVFMYYDANYYQCARLNLEKF